MIASVRNPASSADLPVLDTATIARMTQQGPRYTSYPTADRFSDGYGYGNYLEAVAGLHTRGRRAPLSLYVHVPFCDTVCYYCGCNKVVTKDRKKAATYLSYLKQEIDMQGRLFAGMNKVEQLHFGGGTPTYLSDEQMRDLMAHLRRWFDFAPDDIGEYAIEIDPRSAGPDRIRALRALGFNRLSLGVQDFDPEVQKAVNRIQPEQMTLDVLQAARECGYRSVSIDLIYGLPKQSMESMARTMDKVVQASPDRIALYNYAHMPHLFKPQRRILDADLPDADTRLGMLRMCIERLTGAGYLYIGMDHFAKPADELAVAQRQGRLHRNFQGYSTRAEAELVALGVSAISAVGGTYSQNEKTLDAYYERLDEGKLPVARGVRLATDDLLRRIIIQTLMCNFELSIAAIEQAYPVRFATYFADELARLEPLIADGLATCEDGWITVTPKGRLLVRNVCMVFDRYLGQPRAGETQPLRYSKTV
ncbi:MAG TPA: oxygen-independent coproporphyrinogen III oxidase [Burkholderiaceae bacterium]